MRENLKIFYNGLVKPFMTELKYICMGGFYVFMLAFIKFLYETRADYVLGELIIVPYSFMIIVALSYLGIGLHKSIETDKGGR
ncbi:hypothetical protein PQE70_gp028 [Bacillus phage vB_BanS_Nate]|uniref:Uncharacterized protein n=1 Tax=Bacillus phage vB_BanS_Nate TaxID=2894788 RepID=A0AAE9CE99_9CAUD|nr:hypothetical protein PQE70_gp028 [Bacillus phage vB_BanS_Nate]UGO50881.1 hypothetical protein NATE_28 [Bacillus phage vB_BanS_Nate]